MEKYTTRLSRHPTYVNSLPVSVASLGTLSFQLFVATSSRLLVYALPTHANGDKHDQTAEGGTLQSNLDHTPQGLDLIKTIDLPPISGVPPGSNVTFRATR